jgi:hypothetical protein
VFPRGTLAKGSHLTEATVRKTAAEHQIEPSVFLISALWARLGAPPFPQLTAQVIKRLDEVTGIYTARKAKLIHDHIIMGTAEVAFARDRRYVLEESRRIGWSDVNAQVRQQQHEGVHMGVGAAANLNRLTIELEWIMTSRRAFPVRNFPR